MPALLSSSRPASEIHDLSSDVPDCSSLSGIDVRKSLSRVFSAATKARSTASSITKWLMPPEANTATRRSESQDSSAFLTIRLHWYERRAAGWFGGNSVFLWVGAL